MTRFDLIFVVRDIPTKERDEKIARHIIELHTPQGTDKRSVIDVDLLDKISCICKNDPHLILTKEAEEKISGLLFTNEKCRI